LINKKLLSDVNNQRKLPAVIISANTFNCFDQIAHLIAGAAC